MSVAEKISYKNYEATIPLIKCKTFDINILQKYTGKIKRCRALCSISYSHAASSEPENLTTNSTI